MARSYGRKTRHQVKEILKNPDRQTALDQLAQIPDNQLKGHLFSHFYALDALIRFRSVTAMGHLGFRMADTHMETARDLMRRLMWNLNDESGGIGWGSAEAMGEILSRHSGLAAEFDSILFSFLDPEANFIDNPQLQQSILWGIGTYTQAAPDQITTYSTSLIVPFMDDKDPVKKAYAIRALNHAGPWSLGNRSEYLFAEQTTILMYTGWAFETTRICDLVRETTKQRNVR